MTNRERLERAIADLELILADDAISPTPAVYLHNAVSNCRQAGTFVLDMRERDGIKEGARSRPNEA